MSRGETEEWQAALIPRRLGSTLLSELVGEATIPWFVGSRSVTDRVASKAREAGTLLTTQLDVEALLTTAL